MTISAPKVMLMGPFGTGKTSSLATALAAGLEVFHLATESNAIDSVLKRIKDLGVTDYKYHWKYCMPAAANWKALNNMAKQISGQTYEDLSKMKSGVSKEENKHAITFVESLSDFKCDHCGQSFGDCATWDTSRMLAVDSLTGLNHLSRNLTVGYKPTMHEGEWGVAMNFEEQIIKTLTNGLTCWFTLLAHIDREQDLLTGGTRVTPGALGRKLGPKLGMDFGDVALCKKEGDRFFWSTQETGVDVKHRDLPFSNSILPDFKLLVAAFKQRQSTADQQGKPA